MLERSVSQVYQPLMPNVLQDEPMSDHYQAWNYVIGYEMDGMGAATPNGGNTAIFRIFPQSVTEPVLVTKPEQNATFTVNVLQGKGELIRSKYGDVEKVVLSPGHEVIIHPGEAYSYKNTDYISDLVLHDIALPAFRSGDDVELTSSPLTSETVKVPHEFYDLMGEALTPKPLILETEIEGVTLRQLTTYIDDKAYTKAQNENFAYPTEFNNKAYKTLAKVTDARLHDNGELRMGIWEGNIFVGMIGAKPSLDGKEVQIDYWLRDSVPDHVYATAATRTLCSYVGPKFDSIFEEVDPRNSKRAKVLELVGFEKTGKKVRDGYHFLLFELPT